MTIEAITSDFPTSGSCAASTTTEPGSGTPRSKKSARKSGADDQSPSDAPAGRVVGNNPREGRGSGHYLSDDQKSAAGAAKKSRSRKADAEEIDVGQDLGETHGMVADVDLRFVDPLIVSIVLQHRQRQRWMRARNGLILQGKGFCRGHYDGDKKEGEAAFNRIVSGKPKNADEEKLAVTLIPFIAAMKEFDDHLTRTEKDLERLAKKLPVAAWVDGIKGFGLGSLAAIVGECGDIGAYRTVSGVWRRLGLAPFQKDGVSHAGMTWRVEKWRNGPALKAEDWIEFGYSGRRRSVAWNAADPIARQQREWKGEGLTPAGKPKQKREAGPYGLYLEEMKEKALAKGWSPGHAEAHARRVMFKRVLRDLWVAWRGVADQMRRDAHYVAVSNPINSNESGQSGCDARLAPAAPHAEAA